MICQKESFLKLRAKLIATIMSMCLVITLGVFGILAVKTLNMSVGGNITFSADGLSLEVFDGEFKTTNDLDYSNITTQEGKLQGFVLNTDTKQSDIQSKIDSWTNLELTLDSKGDAVLHFAVKNNMATPLYVYIVTNLGENTNDNMDILVSPNGTEIAAGVKTNFEITFDILDDTINAGLKGFNVAVTFAKEKLIKVQNKLDAYGKETNEVDYYYVEMGVYNGKPVKWRYVADANGTRYDGTNALQSLSGYYVLETFIQPSKSFLDDSKYNSTTFKHLTEGYANINANDYGLSDIREYLTNAGNGGFIESIGVSISNPIYSMITGRTLSDLYSNIFGEDGTAIEETNSSYSLVIPENKGKVDKLWLMSSSEINTLLGQGEDCIWSNGAPVYYWLRSPFSLSVACHSYYIGSGGTFYYNLVTYSLGVRPSFKIA